jgi:hypothetical protein
VRVVISRTTAPVRVCSIRNVWVWLTKPGMAMVLIDSGNCGRVEA